MKTEIETRFIQMAHKYLEDNKGKWRQISAESGVGYQWISKFYQGKFTDPGVTKVERLLRYAGLISEPDQAA